VFSAEAEGRIKCQGSFKLLFSVVIYTARDVNTLVSVSVTVTDAHRSPPQKRNGFETPLNRVSQVNKGRWG
jgi:hypothetical protein